MSIVGSAARVRHPQHRPSRHGAAPSGSGPGPRVPPRDGDGDPVLVVTEDLDLLEEVVDVAGTVGVSVRSVDSAAAAAVAETGLMIVGEDVLVRASPVRGVPCVAVARSITGTTEPSVDVWRSAVRWGAEHVVVLPEGAPWLAGRLAEAAEEADSSGSGSTSAHVMAVVPGHGGAGASLLAASVALAGVSAGAEVALLDCDPAGGGIDLLLGDAGPTGLRWADLAGGAATVSARTLVGSLPRSAGVAVLTSGRVPGPVPDTETVGSVVAAARRAFDLVVVDCPASVPDMLALLPVVDDVVVVCACDVRSAAAASFRCGPLRSYGVPQRLVARGPGPCGLAPQDVARVLELPLAAYVTNDRAAARAADRGRLGASSRRGPLAEVAGMLLPRTRLPSSA